MGKRGPSQQRSRDRREALLRAALDLIAEGGTKSVTHRAVAARADVPLASTTYYFESIQQLTEEALQLDVADRIVELHAIVTSFTGRSAEDFAKQLVDGLVARRGNDLVAQYEVYLESSRNPALRRSVRVAMNAFQRVAANALAWLGAQQPEQAAVMFVAMIDGFALHRLARPMPAAEEAAILFEALRSLFITQVMDRDERDRWEARLKKPLARPREPKQ